MRTMQVWFRCFDDDHATTDTLPTVPINTFQSHLHADAPIRLSYHNNSHYNAVFDPANPTFGVGLGFSDLRPGAADQAWLAQARAVSAAEETERDLVSQVQALSRSAADPAVHSSAQPDASTGEEDMVQAAMQASLQQAAQSDQQLLQQALLESRHGIPPLRMAPATAFEVVSQPHWLSSTQPPGAVGDDDNDDDDDDAMMAAALAASVSDAADADAALSALNRDST